jgi:outer membrane protein OmpA-like peptidoglycan-associated protein
MDIYQVRFELPFESFTTDPLARINFKLPDTVYAGEPVALGAFSNSLPPAAFKEYYWQVDDSLLKSKGEIASHTFTKTGETRVRIQGVTTDDDLIGYEKKIVVISRPVVTVASNTTTLGTNTVSPVKTGTLENVYFEFNGHILNSEAQQALSRNLKILAANPGMTITISAYCDSRGPAQYNEALSRKRARSVEWYLIKHGLSKNRIKTVNWFGEKDPLNKCIDGTPCTAGEYKINRRVEMR